MQWRVRLVGRGPTVLDGKSGFKLMSGFVFAATIVAAQSDHSISNVVSVTSGCATASKVKMFNTHFRIRIFIAVVILLHAAIQILTLA